MFFKHHRIARFLHRPNRFVVHILLNGKETSASLPNPGKLGELLFTDTNLAVVPSKNPDAKHPWRVAAVFTDAGTVIMLDTHINNDVAEVLIKEKKIPALKNMHFVRREVTCGRSRFDFLLEENNEPVYVEVKSCTLFSQDLAMFPDAATSRGTRHVRELHEMAERGIRTVVLFFLHSKHIQYFLPEYHTDLLFTRQILEARKKVTIIPVALEWDRQLSYRVANPCVSIPWHVAEMEAEDRGCYLFIMKLSRKSQITIGSLGTLTFDKGYYVYVGSAMKNLTQRIERHKRQRKQMHWHIDYLRQKAAYHASLPIRATANLECDLAQSVEKIADSSIAQFGSSDCKCGSHLFFFKNEPVRTRPFQKVLLQYRMDRLHAFI